MHPSWITFLTLASVISGVASHPGTHSEDEIKAELRLRNIVTQHSKRVLAKCANSPATQALRDRAVARRVATAHALRQKRGLRNGVLALHLFLTKTVPVHPLTRTTPENILARRDKAALTKWSSISHSSSSEFTLSTTPSEIFSSSPTCALVPESTIGPYYVSGELLRTNLTDSQPGVPIHLDIQFVSTSTCSPIPESSPMLIDIWHCNATGVYSGVSAPGQGGIDTTHGRGVQQTDSDGVVQFDTLFPGHYAGRATHIHLMATSEANILPNKSFTGGKARHIGQLYFDQDLRDQVEKLSPYKENTQDMVRNLDDGLAPGQATEEYDPFLNYVLLGEKITDGLLMWITIGIDTEADYSGRVSVAEHFDGVSVTEGANTPDSTGTGNVVSRTSSAAAAHRWGVMGLGMGW